MNLHEFQAKHIFSQYGIPIPRGFVARSDAEAKAAAKQLGGAVHVVKAQVHAGGRGKAGGVKIAKSLDEVTRYTGEMLGTRLVTHQTDEHGMPINAVMIEEGLDIAREIYLGALVDRASKRVVFMGSAAGGMDIEEVAATEPEKIITVRVNPVAGLQPYQCRQMGFALGLAPAQIKQLTQIMRGLYRCFEERDLSLI